MPPIDTLATDTGDDSIRASLSAAWDAPDTDTENAVSPDKSQDEPAPDAAATAPSTGAENSPELAAASTNKADHPTDPKRYADGSFKPQKPAGAETAAAVTIDPSKDTQTQASAAAQTAIAPPAGWTAAEKAEWLKLSPAVQAAVSRRESEMTNGGKQWSDEKRRYEAMIAPVAQSARARGMDAAQGIQVLVAAQQALDANPIEGIKRIAASYGVDLATLAGTQAADGSREQNPQPDIAALVRQAVQPYVAPIHQRYAAEEQERQQRTVDLVTQFATSPGHEHFESVSNEIMALLPVIQQAAPGISHEKALQEAYDRATFANPTTRAAIQATQAAADEAKRKADATARAQRARSAAVGVTGAPSGAPATEAKDSIRGELEAAWAGA